MSSPLVSRLESEYLIATTPTAKAVLSAQIACYLARVGDFEEAERRRQELRSVFGDGRSPQVSILVMCLEALLLFFKSLDPNARDRLLRAKLLSVACRDRSLAALTSSWLAHIDFNGGRYDEMVKSMVDCSTYLNADDGTASCRLALVLGDAFLYVGQGELARKWYEDARTTATRLGDQAAIASITYNRAALHVADARFRRLSNAIQPSELARIDAEVRSAVNYQAAARLTSLDHLLRSASIGTLMLAEQYDKAADAIQALISTLDVPSGTAELALLYADNAQCLVRLGRPDDARQMAEAARSVDAQDFDPDDQSILFNALAQYSELVGEDANAKKYRDLSADSVSRQHETIARLVELLRPFASGPRQLPNS